MLICERPYTSHHIGIFARKNGEYNRPILAKFLDVRLEDFMPDRELISKYASKYIAKLPDIPEMNQIGKYFLADSNLILRVDLDEQEAHRHMDAGSLMLPHTPKSPYWKYTRSPWWEYCSCFDDHDGYIKAPKIPRKGEPHPEEIDELIDKFEENRGKIHIVSPQTLMKWQKVGMTEDYISRLNRI